jgi:hypothetical protein
MGNTREAVLKGHRMTTHRSHICLLLGILVLLLLLLPSPVFAHTQIKVSKSSQKIAQSVPSCPQIPKNKSLMQFSDTELAHLGLPSHATISKNLTMWERQLKNAQHICTQTTPLNFRLPLAEPAKTTFFSLQLLIIVILILFSSSVVIFVSFVASRRVMRKNKTTSHAVKG